MNNYVNCCSRCGSTLIRATQFSNGEFYGIYSYDYIDNWPICRSCMIEHCCSTNCMGCEFNQGDYQKCQFLKMKQHYMKEEELT